MIYSTAERRINLFYAEARKWDAYDRPAERERSRIAHLEYARGLTLYMRIVSNGARFA